MYYGGKMKAWEADLKCARQVTAIEEMDAESENCRAA